MCDLGKITNLSVARSQGKIVKSVWHTASEGSFTSAVACAVDRLPTKAGAGRRGDTYPEVVQDMGPTTGPEVGWSRAGPWLQLPGEDWGRQSLCASVSPSLSETCCELISLGLGFSLSALLMFGVGWFLVVWAVLCIVGFCGLSCSHALGASSGPLVIEMSPGLRSCALG